MRRSTIGAAVIGLLVWVFWVAAPSIAHTPDHGEDCTSIRLSGTNYNTQHGDSANSWSISEDGTVVDSGTFGASFDASVPTPQNGETHHWVSHIQAWDDPTGSKGWTKTYTADVGPCGTPPPCDQCHMVKHQTDAPPVTYCRGVIENAVLNDVVVKPGLSCTLVDSYVNGQVSSYHGRNVTLADTSVVGNVLLSHVSGDVTVGPLAGNCAYDPQVGGSIEVRDSHNVLVCGESVCHSVKVLRDDGRITVKQTAAHRIKVTGNRRYVSDGPTGHAHPSWIRLLGDTAVVWQISGNAPRKVDRR